MAENREKPGPGKQGGVDKRQFFRLDFPAPVRYRFAKKTAPGEYRVSPYFKGKGVNFSGGGAALNVGKPLPPKTLVQLEMIFPFRERPVMAAAEVVRREAAELKGQAVSLIMVRFLLIDEADQSKLVSFLISRGKVVS
ncbi:MAG: PilZ domain-containing protein [Candidatus Nitrospinota bacterium M3_3B_026]